MRSAGTSSCAASNLGGDCKLPYPDGDTCRPADFADHRTVSFIGRPFPREDADAHLARIAGWGFNCLRLLTTWEAVEHAGHRDYDVAYIEYLADVVARAEAFGLYVIVDFHQDVWSRMSGGSGAPGWIFAALGLDLTRFDAADAVHVMQYRYDFTAPSDAAQRYAPMSWPRNYQMAVNGIMWTAFFAGRKFMPDWLVDDVNVQDFLQGAYLGAMQAVASRLKDCRNVIGFDTLNEPGSGWIGRRLTHRHLKPDAEEPLPPFPGPAWSPLDGLRVARGLTTTLPVAGGDGAEAVMNPDGVSIWFDPGPDPFERSGIWRSQDGVAIRDDAFLMIDGRPADFMADFMGPFFRMVAETVRKENPAWLVFAEFDPLKVLQGHGFPKTMPERWVNASHWYDLATLMTKRFSLAGTFDYMTMTFQEGAAGIADCYRRQLERMRDVGGPAEGTGSRPSLIGEFGIPYDLNQRMAFDAWRRGDHGRHVWQAHEAAWALMYEVLDDLLLSATQWNYTASNRNDPAVGDGWNLEDLSIFSIDQQAGGNDGARALHGFCRPYVRAAAGRILGQAFDRKARRFSFSILVDGDAKGQTEISLPGVLFPDGVDVEPRPSAFALSAGIARLTFPAGRVDVVVRPKAAVSPQIPRR